MLKKLKYRNIICNITSEVQEKNTITMYLELSYEQHLKDIINNLLINNNNDEYKINNKKILNYNLA
jgi:hypothetical protein